MILEKIFFGWEPLALTIVLDFEEIHTLLI